MSAETLDDIVLPLADRRAGKVRVSYALPGHRRLFVTTDRLSAFDRFVACVPYKGQVLNQLAAWWFEHTRDIVDNHLIAVPDENVSVTIAAQPLPVEVIVRGYITGVTGTSLWTRYAAGQRTIDGHHLPEGLLKNHPLPHHVITPTTKGEAGEHDVPLSCTDVVERALVAPALWGRVQEVALALFARGQEVAARAGLILADTKYEFGLAPNGGLRLIDEVHTPDSSRFWVRSTYDERVGAGLEPESLDKELVRRALVDAGHAGDGPVPALPSSVYEDTSRRYITAYETITGEHFHPGASPIAERIARNIAAFLERDHDHD